MIKTFKTIHSQTLVRFDGHPGSFLQAVELVVVAANHSAFWNPHKQLKSFPFF